jgi:hypothetical protein
MYTFLPFNDERRNALIQFHPKKVIIIFLILLSMTACTAPAVHPGEESTKVAFSPPTLSPSITQIRTFPPKPTRTAQPNPTQVIPTSTSTPFLPDLPDLSHSVDHYELVEPSISVLGSVLENAESLKDESWDLYHKQQALSEMITTNAELQFAAAVFSLQQQEKQHPLDIDSLLNVINWGRWLWIFGDPPQNAVDVILNAVTNHIQKQAYQFQDQSTITQNKLSLTPYKIELDHDPGTEWLVQVKIADTGLLCFLLFDENADGSYRRLESQIPHFSQDDMVEHKVLLLKDFTGDGLTDVLISKYFYVMGSSITLYYVSQGNKAGMSLIEAYSTNGYAYTYEGPVPSQVVDETTLAGLKLTYSEDLNWDCVWKHEVTFHWIGGVEQRNETGQNAPDTPECWFAKAVSLNDPVDDQTAIHLLQSAIYKLNPAQDEKTAFAHYRLALLYLKNGQQSMARKHLSSLQKFYANDPITSEYLKEALSPMLDQPSLNLLPVCQMGYASPYEAFPGWREYTYSTNVYHSYPGGQPVPEAICPLIDIVETQMNKIDFNGAGSPAEAIQRVGLPIQLIQSYSLPDWVRPAWFVVLDTQPYIVIANVPYSENHEFIWKRMSIFDYGDSQPSWLNQDVTGDGIAEMAIAVKNNHYYCDSGMASYQLLLTGAIHKNLTTSIAGLECFSASAPLNLVEIMKDNDGDGLSDLLVKFSKETFPASDWLDLNIQRNGPVTWFTREEIWNMTQPSEQSERENNSEDPEKAIFSGKNPVEVRQKIQKLLNDLSPDSPYYQLVHDRYRYLVALSYELEGNTQEAILSYLELARSEPGTIWSNLANRKQNPHKKTTDVRYVRVTHAGHPLAGQIVRTVRQAGHPAFGELQWVLELKDASRISIPLSWGEPVEDPAAAVWSSEAERLYSRPLIDANAYLNLAKMVCQLKMNQPEEGTSHESPTTADPTTGRPATTEPEAGSTLCMGSTSHRTPARTDYDSGGNPDPATARHVDDRSGETR